MNFTIRSTAGLFASTFAAALAAQSPSLTIYNQQFAVVRERVPLALQSGVTDVSFAPIDAVFTLRNVVVHGVGEDATDADGTPAITAGRVRIDVQWLPLLHR